MLIAGIAGKYRTNPWTGLTLMPECRCRTETVLATGRNADVGLTFSGIPVFRHLHMILQHQHSVERITPANSRDGRRECITFHYLQFGVLDVKFVSISPKPAQQKQYGYGRASVPLSTASSLDVQGVPLFSASSSDVQAKVYSFPQPAVWTCKVYFSPSRAV